jgi:hypothetical protein
VLESAKRVAGFKKKAAESGTSVSRLIERAVRLYDKD